MFVNLFTLLDVLFIYLRFMATRRLTEKKKHERLLFVVELLNHSSLYHCITSILLIFPEKLRATY